MKNFNISNGAISSLVLLLSSLGTGAAVLRVSSGLVRPHPAL